MAQPLPKTWTQRERRDSELFFLPRSRSPASASNCQNLIRNQLARESGDAVPKGKKSRKLMSGELSDVEMENN